MALIKKNKLKIIIAVVLLLAVFAFLTIADFVFPNDRKDLYGNRLEGIEDVLISEKRFTDVRNAFKEQDFVSKVDFRVQGRIINAIVTVKENTDVNKAKMLSDTFISHFEKEELEYYDLQLFLLSERENENYPYIGYKHKTSKIFTWSNN